MHLPPRSVGLHRRGEHAPPPYSGSHPFYENPDGSLEGGAIAVIVIFVLLIVGIVAWVSFTCFRARRLGLPTPGWRNFIPFASPNKSAYSATRPRGAGGLFGFLKPSSGGYQRDRTARGFNNNDEVWDTHMDGDELETQYRGAQRDERGLGEAVSNVLPRGREQDLGAGMEQERGRSRSREEIYQPPTGAASTNPFDQDVRKKDGFDAVRIQGGRMSVESERRSIFREGI
ncbi:hypothetical protein BZA77DRAFT_281880 [Pyronema omphalodes]|nr:hypothetical protein BZA77DRAFT_281880 [Pyronema omphalodes]